MRTRYDGAAAVEHVPSTQAKHVGRGVANRDVIWLDLLVLV